METKDYYRTLQVDRLAETEVIQVAYRRLARKYHPDVNPSGDATRMMKELNEAFEVLGDPVRRANYDRQLESKSKKPTTHDDRSKQPGAPVNGQPSNPSETITDHLFSEANTELSLNGETIVQRSRHSPDNKCLCSQCNYVWTSRKRDSIPAICPRCRSDRWNKYRILQCRHCGARFISGNFSVAAYSLFRTCPNCHASDWHAGEERRKRADVEARRMREEALIRQREKEREQELQRMALRIRKVSLDIAPVAFLVFSLVTLLVVSGIQKLLVSIYDLAGYVLLALAILILLGSVGTVLIVDSSRQKRYADIIACRLDELIAGRKISLGERKKIKQYIQDLNKQDLSKLDRRSLRE
jgi:curved DNA-binding protein CbpA